MSKFLEAVKCMGQSIAGLFNSAKMSLPHNYTPVKEYIYDDISRIILAYFGDVKTVMVNDLRYHSYTLSDFKYWIEKDKTDEAIYSTDYFDCDDFAYVFFASTRKTLIGCPVGVCYVMNGAEAHALNFFIDENRKLMMYEPQTDRVFEKAPGTIVYFVTI